MRDIPVLAVVMLPLAFGDRGDSAGVEVRIETAVPTAAWVGRRPSSRPSAGLIEDLRNRDVALASESPAAQGPLIRR